LLFDSTSLFKYKAGTIVCQ